MQSQNPFLYREYIGHQGAGVKFTDVPIDPNVEFHFILAFALDYNVASATSTHGNFNIFWDYNSLSPDQVSSIKNAHSNVKVALSLGGDRVGNGLANFSPNPNYSTDEWVSNAVSSLTKIIKQYHLDGIDIDYEHFNANPDTFAVCIGKLITTLKRDKVISFASIAPFDDDQVQSKYLALWNKYKHQIDYVNFQFYKYPKTTDTQSFLRNFENQSTHYDGGKVLASYISDGSGGLSPANGFLDACTTLKNQQKLRGIFVWSVDISVQSKAQRLLAYGH